MDTWHEMTPEAALLALSVDRALGLDDEEAKARLGRHGPNEFREAAREGVAHMLLRQLGDVANVILLLAVALSLALAVREGRGYLEPAVMLVIVVANVVLAVSQERGAERALEALRRLNGPTCLVLRGAVRLEVDTAVVVPGDILLLRGGDLVPADARLLEANGLLVDESSLTGESEPSEKDARAVVGGDVPVGDMATMVFSGCFVTAGNAVAVVVATGMDTQMGRIASYLDDAQRLQTPLRRRLDRVGRAVSFVAVASAAVLLAVGTYQGEDPWTMALAAVSLAVAAVPETLQLIVTLTLAQGTGNMVTRNALVRRLPAVETLGSVSVICSDKTGTLTQNCMSVQRLWVPGHGVASVADGLDTGQRDLLDMFALASNASVEVTPRGAGRVVGDATEGAVLRLLADEGGSRAELEAAWPRVGEVPFSSSRKMMTSVHRCPSGGYVVLTKGAFDRLPYGSATDAEREERRAVHDELAGEALRVLALASRRVRDLPGNGDLESLEHDLEFEGLVGLMDPPRPEVARAIATARRAGIRTVMITGDHAATAAAVAREVGLDEEGSVITGQQLAGMSDEQLIEGVRSCSVYARASPEDKIRIVEAWQENGEVVAMTGDGVNDAPALKAADVGIAMGRSGTEVAKSAADTVLTDDDFATIVSAVREGRNVFSNIRKTIYFLLVCNMSEIVIMLGAQLAGWGIPLTPLMLLLINVLGDGIPGLRLAWERSDERIMGRRPIGRDESFFGGGILRVIVLQTAAVAAVGLAAYRFGTFAWLDEGVAPSQQVGRTMAFLVTALTSILHVFTVRSRASLLRRTVRDNMPLLYVALGMVALFVSMAAVPFLAAALGFAALGPVGWSLVAGLVVVPTVFAELVKLWDNRCERRAYGRRLVRHGCPGEEG